MLSNILWKLQNKELSARGSKELVSSDSGIDIHPPISLLHMANTHLKCFANSNLKIITNTNFRYLANSLEYKKELIVEQLIIAEVSHYRQNLNLAKEHVIAGH